MRLDVGHALERGRGYALFDSGFGRKRTLSVKSSEYYPLACSRLD